MDKEEKDIRQVIPEALYHAREQFNKTLSHEGFDPAYCNTRFTVWLMDSSFTIRLAKFEIEEEVKETSHER